MKAPTGISILVVDSLPFSSVIMATTVISEVLRITESETTFNCKVLSSAGSIPMLSKFMVLVSYHHFTLSAEIVLPDLLLTLKTMFSSGIANAPFAATEVLSVFTIT
ncbi:MAG: hypothetical protein LBC44_00945 [Mycoplasmataceae bacterium]|nr:hypothetical protein [Mycoplasmataceae bacterium]